MPEHLELTVVDYDNLKNIEYSKEEILIIIAITDNAYAHFMLAFKNYV